MDTTPHEYLKEQMNTTIEVYTLNNKRYSGELKGIDNCENIHLNNTMEYQNEGEDSIFLGTTLINGGNVAFFNVIN